MFHKLSYLEALKNTLSLRQELYISLKLQLFVMIINRIKFMSIFLNLTQHSSAWLTAWNMQKTTCILIRYNPPPPTPPTFNHPNPQP